jgi:tripartite-type tricarboxylate transporter receptor subunit TctC
MRILIAALLFLSHVAAGQSYPTKPIRFIISFGPGSASDALARIAGQELTQSLGQPVVVMAKPGADGALSGLEIKRATPDGYTFLFGSNSALAVVVGLRKDPPYDPTRDFTPITYLGDNTFFVAVHPSVPAKSLQELVAYAKAKPNAINYPAGNTYALVATALFAANNGIAMRAVPYKSELDSVPDLLSGRVHLLFGTSTILAPHVKEGRLRVLATTLNERSPLMPEVPTFVESGQAKMPIGPWFGLVGPAGLPRQIVTRMNKEMVAVLAKPTVKELMLRQGFMASSSTPEALGAHIKDQIGVWKTALKAAGVEAQ